MTFRLLNRSNLFAKFMKHLNNKIEEQVLNTCKMPENPTKCKRHEENDLFFFPPGLQCDLVFVPEKEGTDKCIVSLEASCCSKTTQQCFPGSISRGGDSILSPVLAKKSELSQSTNGRT